MYQETLERSRTYSHLLREMRRRKVLLIASHSTQRSLNKKARTGTSHISLSLSGRSERAMLPL